MRPTLNTFVLLLSVMAAYLWLKTPVLNIYSIQAVAASSLLYFIFKRTKPWHVLPSHSSFELVFVTFSLLLTIGKTGNLTSPLYPLTYIHLFFLVMSTSTPVALMVMAGACLFHLSLAPYLDLGVFVHIATLPIVMIFFLFAKQQHEELVIEKQRLTSEGEIVNSQEESLAQLSSELQLLRTRQQATVQEMSGLTELLRLCLTTIKSWQGKFFACEPGITAQIEQLSQEIKLKLEKMKS